MRPARKAPARGDDRDGNSGRTEFGYRIGDAHVSVSARTILRNGEALRPRPKSFELLLFLIQRRGQIATKDEILSQVWRDVVVTQNSLVKCVLELRKALGDDPKDPRLLRSVPKVGYELVGVVEEIPSAGEPSVSAALELLPAATIAASTKVERPEPEPVQVQPSQLARSARVRWAMGAFIPLAAGFFLWSGKQIREWTQTPVEVPLREAAWWKLNDAKGATAVNAAASDQSGAIVGGTAWVPGKLGGALWFNGVDSAIIGRGRLPSGAEPRTISAWIKVSVPLLSESEIFAFGSDYRGPTNQRFSAGVHSNGKVGFGSAIRGGFLEGAARVDDDSWHMMTVAYDGAATNWARIFVDGKLDKVGKLTVAPDTSDRFGWTIGRSPIRGAAFRGVIDDVRVYNSALDEAKMSALYRCSSGRKDLGEYYFLPVFQPANFYGLVFEDRRDGDLSTSFRNSLDGFAGIQLARSDGSCAIRSLRGADVGQDVRISVDLLVPAVAADTVAGPYFRSRKALAGEGLIGGTSAGYWVQLQSNGMLKVKLLNPQSVIAYSIPPPAFDAAIFHHLEIEARGENLQAWLDGKSIFFDYGGQRVERVPIPPAWKGPPILGRNEGTAGVAFGAEEYHWVGGERAKNLQVTNLD